MHRLRDLDRGERLAAAGLVALVLVPFAASLARVVHQGYLPTGDDALIGLRGLDVFSRHVPLVGQPSTSDLYAGRIPTSHPGPIEFYWLAIPMRIFGTSAGMIVGSVAANLAGVLVAAWVMFRRGGIALGGWSLVGLGGVLWSEGTAVLSDPISSNAGGIPLLALAALAWAVLDGDLALLPLAAVFASWVAQQHLAILTPAAAMAVVAATGALWFVLTRRSPAHRADPDRVERPWPWIGAGAGVAFVLWLPVLWQQVTGHPGNLSAMLHYARGSHQAKVGLAAGFRQAVRALGFPPLFTRWDLGGGDFFGGPLRPLEKVFGLIGYALLVGIVAVMWRRRRPLALLAVTALVLAAAGIVSGASIPVSVESFRVNLYRWVFVVTWLSWVCFGWAVVVLVLDRIDQDELEPIATLPQIAAAAAAFLLLLPAVASVATASADDARRDQAGFGIIHRAADAAVAQAVGKGRVTLVLKGSSAILASGPAVTLALSANGHHVLVPGVSGRYYGGHRVLHPGEDPGQLILELVTGRGEVASGPGRVVFHGDLNPTLNRDFRSIAAVAHRSPVVLSPSADQLLREHWPDQGKRDFVKSRLALIRLSPQYVLGDPNLLRVVGEGYFTSPAFTREQLATVRRDLPARSVNDDDVFEVRVLSRAQLAEEVPAWAKR